MIRTWALLRWCSTKRRYIKCTYLYLLPLPRLAIRAQLFVFVSASYRNLYFSECELARRSERGLFKKTSCGGNGTSVGSVMRTEVAAGRRWCGIDVRRPANSTPSDRHRCPTDDRCLYLRPPAPSVRPSVLLSGSTAPASRISSRPVAHPACRRLAERAPAVCRGRRRLPATGRHRHAPSQT